MKEVIKPHDMPSQFCSILEANAEWLLSISAYQVEQDITHVSTTNAPMWTIKENLFPVSGIKLI